jgi:hypothetical protein
MLQVKQKQIKLLSRLQVVYHHQIILHNQLQIEHLNQLHKKVDNLLKKQLQRK